MAMKNVRDNFAIQNQMQEALRGAGIDQTTLDKLMSTTSIERILSDTPAVFNYFKLASLGLSAVVDPQQYYEVRGAIPTPDQYKEYYDNHNSQPTPYFNMIPSGDLFNPEALGQNAGFTQDQVHAYGKLLAGPGPSQATSWNEVQGGPAPGGGKAMSTGGPYGPQSKTLQQPGGAPGYGGGGGVPPGGFAPGGPSTGFDPTASTQEGRAYVDANFQGDPSYGWFLQLFNRQDFVTGIYASGVQQLDEVRRMRQRILEEMSGADPKKVTMLNYQMQDLSSREREITDKMMRAQHYQNEFVNMVKGMIDVQMRTTDAIVRNMRQ